VYCTVNGDPNNDAVSLTSEIVANDLNGVITRHLAAVIPYDATLIVDPVARVNTDR